MKNNKFNLTHLHVHVHYNKNNIYICIPNPNTICTMTERSNIFRLNTLKIAKFIVCTKKK